MARGPLKLERDKNLAVATLAGRGVDRPMTRLVEEATKQESFLTAYAEKGILTDALRAGGVMESDFNRWMTQDEVFVDNFQSARRCWADHVRGWVNAAAMEGIPEPVIYKGQVQYQRDPDTGEFILDARGHRIPVTVNKRDNRVLMKLAEANLDEFARGRQGGDHTSKKGISGGVNLNISFVPAKDGRPAPIDVVPDSVEYDPFG